jgi:DHA2 family multidrug resistance protein-like MFS transporter
MIAVQNNARRRAGAPSRATRGDWIGLAVLVLPCVLYAMDLTVLDLALPAISADLRPTSVELLWIVDIYGFLVATSLITMGTLGDRVGHRRVLLAGAAAFGMASTVAAFATSPGTLIAARALLGVAGATFAPSTLSLIRNMFDDARERTVAISVWATSYSAGGALGPSLGGLLLAHFWWGSVFLVGVPLMLLLLAVGPGVLPEFRDPRPGRIDVTSVALSLAATLAIIYGVKQIAQDGITAAPTLVMMIGASLAIAFVRRQCTLREPLIDLRLLRVPALGASIAVYALGTFVAFGSFLYVTQYMQLVLALGPLRAGLWTTPFAAAFLAGSIVSPLLARRTRPAYVMAGGFALAAVGFGLLTRIATAPSLGLLVSGFVVYSLGLAPMFTLCNDLIVAAAPRRRAGAVSAVSETGSELGGALGIAVFGSLGTAVYGNAIAAETLPRSLALVAAVCAVLVIVMAVIVTTSLRHVGMRQAASA